ncbi:MAG: WbuC family cupin fold metalloprotein [Balneolales bacterium]|nr:WbuC family cupin fold metalloprotein [Balneolales bacterium]
MTKLAFENISGSVFNLDENQLEDGLSASRNSPRKRFILPIHRTQNATVQRMINFMQPGTYIRPHLHPRAHACESIVVFKGAIRFKVYDENGRILQKFIARAGTASAVLDIEPNVWHGFDVLEPDTVLFESKMGPYDVELDKIFAPWAPKETF